MFFTNRKKSLFKVFFFFWIIVSSLGFIGRAQAGSNEGRVYFQNHMPELVLDPTGNFQCLMISAVPGTPVPSPLSFQLIQDLKNGFETILTEFDNGVGGNQLSSDWYAVFTNILKQPVYSCLGLNDVNYPQNRPAQALNRVGNMALFMLMAGGNSPGSGATATPIPLLFSTYSVDFGSVKVSTLSGPQTVTITSFSNSTITFRNGTFSNRDFDASENPTSCGRTLAAGATCSFDLFFKASGNGTETGTLVIDYVDGNGSAYSTTLNLKGTGIAPAFGLCGDGALESGEECDDGNTADGDGCTAACTKESVLNPNQTPNSIPDPSGAAGGGCSMGVATSAPAVSLLSFFPFGLVAFARVYRKK